MVALSHRTSSPPAFPQPAPPRHRKAAEIVTHYRLNLFQAREAYRAACAECVALAFPAPSRNGCCEAAYRATGASPDTFERILSGATQSPDAVLMGFVASVYEARTGRVSPVIELMVQIARAA